MSAVQFQIDQLANTHTGKENRQKAKNTERIGTENIYVLSVLGLPLYRLHVPLSVL